MKITINTDDRYSETEIIINCNQMSDDIEKLLASIRLYDLKIFGHKKGRQYILEASDIIYIDSVDKRTFIYTLTETYESNLKLCEFEEKYTNNGIIRISKNCLVNIKHIEYIETEFNSRLILKLPKGVKLIVSRQYASQIKQKLEAYHG